MDTQNYPARIKILEAIRRAARTAGEHTTADQLTNQIDELRKERANARPLTERIKSAEAKLTLAQQEVQKALRFARQSKRAEESADKDLADVAAELEGLRQQQQQQPPHPPEADAALENLMEFFDELADAVEATPAAKTARIYAALTAVRTILLNEANRDTHSAHSQDDDEMQHSDDEDTDLEAASSVDHTCESEPASTSEPKRSRTRAAGTRRNIPHYNLGRDSDPETIRHTAAPPRVRGRPSRSRSKSPPKRSRSPTVPA